MATKASNDDALDKRRRKSTRSETKEQTPLPHKIHVRRRFDDSWRRSPQRFVVASILVASCASIVATQTLSQIPMLHLENFQDVDNESMTLRMSGGAFFDGRKYNELKIERDGLMTLKRPSTDSASQSEMDNEAEDALGTDEGTQPSPLIAPWWQSNLENGCEVRLRYAVIQKSPLSERISDEIKKVMFTNFFPDEAMVVEWNHDCPFGRNLQIQVVLWTNFTEKNSGVLFLYINTQTKQMTESSIMFGVSRPVSNVIDKSADDILSGTNVDSPGIWFFDFDEKMKSRVSGSRKKRSTTSVTYDAFNPEYAANNTESPTGGPCNSLTWVYPIPSDTIKGCATCKAGSSYAVCLHGLFCYNKADSIATYCRIDEYTFSRTGCTSCPDSGSLGDCPCCIGGGKTCMRKDEDYGGLDVIQDNLRYCVESSADCSQIWATATEAPSTTTEGPTETTFTTQPPTTTPAPTDASGNPLTQSEGPTEESTSAGPATTAESETTAPTTLEPIPAVPTITYPNFPIDSPVWTTSRTATCSSEYLTTIHPLNTTCVICNTYGVSCRAADVMCIRGNATEAEMLQFCKVDAFTYTFSGCKCETPAGAPTYYPIDTTIGEFECPCCRSTNGLKGVKCSNYGIYNYRCVENVENHTAQIENCLLYVPIPQAIKINSTNYHPYVTCHKNFSVTVDKREFGAAWISGYEDASGVDENCKSVEAGKDIVFDLREECQNGTSLSQSAFTFQYIAKIDEIRNSEYDRRYEHTCSYTTTGDAYWEPTRITAELKKEALIDYKTEIVLNNSKVILVGDTDDTARTLVTVGDLVRIKITANDVDGVTYKGFGVTGCKIYGEGVDQAGYYALSIIDENGCNTHPSYYNPYPTPGGGIEFSSIYVAYSRPFVAFKFLDSSELFLKCSIVFCVHELDVKCQKPTCSTRKRRSAPLVVEDGKQNKRTVALWAFYVFDKGKGLEVAVSHPERPSVQEPEWDCFIWTNRLIYLIIILIVCLAILLFMYCKQRSGNDNHKVLPSSHTRLKYLENAVGRISTGGVVAQDSKYATSGDLDVAEIFEHDYARKRALQCKTCHAEKHQTAPPPYSITNGNI